MKNINQSLKDSLQDFIVIVLSLIISNFFVQIIFKSDNIWIIIAVASILSVILNRVLEKIEYKLLDKKLSKKKDTENN